jgi:hypothetical protein
MIRRNNLLIVVKKALNAPFLFVVIATVIRRMQELFESRFIDAAR